MRYMIVVVVSLAISLCISQASAQPNRDGGPTGTLNHDYFYPDKDAHTKWLIKDVEKNHLQPAKADLRARRFSKAEKDLKFLLDRFVNHPKGLLLMGLLSKLTDKSALAIRYYEKALKLYPQYALTYAQYGNFLVDIGRTRAGVEKLKKAVDLNQKLAVAHAWLAKAYTKTGDVKLAHQTAEQARKLGYRKPIR